MKLVKTKAPVKSYANYGIDTPAQYELQGDSGEVLFVARGSRYGQREQAQYQLYDPNGVFVQRGLSFAELRALCA